MDALRLAGRAALPQDAGRAARPNEFNLPEALLCPNPGFIRAAVNPGVPTVRMVNRPTGRLLTMIHLSFFSFDRFCFQTFADVATVTGPIGHGPKLDQEERKGTPESAIEDGRTGTKTTRSKRRGHESARPTTTSSRISRHSACAPL
jgi:hypothetical protein